MSVLYRRISNPGGFAGETWKKNARSCEERVLGVEGRSRRERRRSRRMVVKGEREIKREREGRGKKRRRETASIGEDRAW